MIHQDMRVAVAECLQVRVRPTGFAGEHRWMSCGPCGGPDQTIMKQLFHVRTYTSSDVAPIPSSDLEQSVSDLAE
jgi:hypothetical protein